MFLFCFYNPRLYDSVQYWSPFEKETFITESVNALTHITPLITQTSTSEVKKRWNLMKDDLFWGNLGHIPSNTLARWPMKLIVYANDFAWKWVFEPPHCPLYPVEPQNYPKRGELDVAQKYDFFCPARFYEGDSLAEAIQPWTIADRIWLDYAFDLISESIPEILENPHIGKTLVKWCEQNGFSKPLFANGKFYAYHPRLGEVVPIEDETFDFLCQTLFSQEETVKNPFSYNICSPQVQQKMGTTSEPKILIPSLENPNYLLSPLIDDALKIMIINSLKT